MRCATSCLESRMPGVLSPIQQAEREDAITDWLADARRRHRIAEPLAETAVTIDALDQIGRAVSAAPPLAAVLRWIAAGCSVRELTSEIQEAPTRISGLCWRSRDSRTWTRPAVAEPVDLTSRLGNTVAVLQSKARIKSVAVTVDRRTRPAARAWALPAS